MNMTQAKPFCLRDQAENEVCLKDFLGKWVVLYFYPKDNTPGCTIEAKDFSADFKDFENLDAVVIGVSADSCDSHKRFAEKHNLKLRLLSDPDKQVLKAYGAWGKKKFMGREFDGIIRSTYLIDPKGNIVKHWPKVSVKGHAAEVRAAIEASTS